MSKKVKIVSSVLVLILAALAAMYFLGVFEGNPTGVSNADLTKMLVGEWSAEEVTKSYNAGRQITAYSDRTEALLSANMRFGDDGKVYSVLRSAPVENCKLMDDGTGDPVYVLAVGEAQVTEVDENTTYSVKNGRLHVIKYDADGKTKLDENRYTLRIEDDNTFVEIDPKTGNESTYKRYLNK